MDDAVCWETCRWKSWCYVWFVAAMTVGGMAAIRITQLNAKAQAYRGSEAAHAR